MAKVIRIDSKKSSHIKKATFLYFFLFTLFLLGAIALFKQQYKTFFIELFAFIFMFTGTQLINKGLAFEKEYQERSFIKLSFFQKYKLYGAIFFASSLSIIEFFINSHNIFQTFFVFLLGIFGVLLFYGLDPFKDKIPPNIHNYEKFFSTLYEARQKVDTILKATHTIQNNTLKEKINQAANKAKEILKTIEQDPKDLSIARKFIVVYLDGIKDVINQYNQIDKELLDESYTQRLIELLNEASNRFEKELEKLKSNEIFDLDVQIDALKQQLKES